MGPSRLTPSRQMWSLPTPSPLASWLALPRLAAALGLLVPLAGTALAQAADPAPAQETGAPATARPDAPADPSAPPGADDAAGQSESSGRGEAASGDLPPSGPGALAAADATGGAASPWSGAPRAGPGFFPPPFGNMPMPAPAPQGFAVPGAAIVIVVVPGGATALPPAAAMPPPFAGFAMGGPSAGPGMPMAPGAPMTQGFGPPSGPPGPSDPSQGAGPPVRHGHQCNGPCREWDREGAGLPGMDNPRRRLDDLDRNGDGMLSALELVAEADAAITTLDFDSNGGLSLDEIRVAPGPRGDVWMRHDADGDGALQPWEYADAIEERFRSLDTDGDGQLTPTQAMKFINF